MADNYDGDIQLSVGLSVDEVRKQARGLANDINKVFKNVDSSTMTNQMKKLASSLSKTESQVSQTMWTIDALEQKYNNAKHAESLGQQIDALSEKYEELSKQAAEAGENIRLRVPIERKMEAIKEEVTPLIVELQQLAAAGQNVFTEADWARLDDAKNKLGDLNNTQRIQLSQLQQLQQAEQEKLAEEQRRIAAEEEAARLEQSQNSEREREMQRQVDILRGDLNPAIAEITDKYEANAKQIAQLTEEQRKLVEEEHKGVGYKEYDEKTAAIARLKEEQKSLTQQIEEYNSTLTDEYQEQQKVKEGEELYQNILRQTQQIRDSEIADAVSRIQELQQNIDNMVEQQKELSNLGFGPGTEQFDNLTSNIGAAKREMGELKDTVDAYNKKLEEGEQSTNKVVQLLQKLKTGAKEVVKVIGKIAVTGLQISPFGKVVDSLKQKFTNLTGAISKTSKSTSSFSNSMGGLIKKLLSYGLGIASVTVLFRKLRQAIKEGIDNLVQTNGGLNSTNQAISFLMSSLNALKNSWGAAFAPIIQTVAPILAKFVDMITQFVNKISMLIAGLFGRTTATIAKKTEANYAKSLDKSGTASGSKQKEKYDAAVEKANKKYEEKVAAVTKKNAEAQAKAEEKQAKAAEKLAKKQEKANQQLGAYDQLNVIAKEDAEELEDIQATEYEMPELELPDMEDYMTGMTDFDSMFEEVPIESAITDLINRLKEAWANADFTQFGRDVGQKIKELSDEATKWLVNVAQPLAEQIGTSLGTFINGLTEDGDVAISAGRMIGEGLNTITTGMNAFLDTTDWTQVGTFVADGFNGLVDAVDWEALGHMWIMKWNAIFESLDGFAKEFDFKKFGASIGQAVETIFKDFDAKSFGSAIGGWVAGIFETIAGFIEEIDWFELGQTIIEKIVDAVTGIDWGRVLSAAFEALGAAIGGAAALIFGLMEKIGEMIVTAWEDWFKENALTESGEFTIEGFLNGILDALKNIGQWIYDNIFKPFIDGFKKAFKISSLSKVMEEEGDFIMEGLKNGISEKISSVVAKFTELKNKIVSVFNSLKTTVISVWNTMWNGIKKVINSILGGIEKMANGVISGFNRLINGINNLNIDIPDWIPEDWGGGHSIGFNIPTLGNISIPRLAQGAVIPPNKEFLAMLGDQKSGTNIEAPIDTIMDALNAVLDKREEISNHEPIVLQLDSRTVAECVWDEEEKRYKQRGVSYSPIFAT